MNIPPVHCKYYCNASTFMNNLRKEFQITESPLGSYLGMEITQNDDGSIFLSQEHYAQKVCKHFNMETANPVTIPIGPEGQSQNDVDLGPEVPYRQAVGSLMYLATVTRPDIAFAVGVVSRKVAKPTVSDWVAVKRIMKYLRGTYSLGLLYKKGYKPGVLESYSDADYGGDALTKRSTSGAVSLYGGGAVSWLSRRQKSVSLSTTHAEYVAASEGTKDLIWLSRLLKELTVLKGKPTLLVDNESALKLVKNPVFHNRSKHIEIRYHFVREKYEEGAMDIQHVETKLQVADVMTKPLPRVRFECLRLSLGLTKSS